MKTSLKKVPNRSVVYAKDIENITGRKPRAARKLHGQIKAAFEKHPKQFVTVQEFSLYTGIDEEIVREYLEW
jgi:hypothetical protein